MTDPTPLARWRRRRPGLLAQFLLVLVPVFLLLSGGGLTVLGRHDNGLQLAALIARVGNRSARVAEALGRHDPAGQAELAQDLLTSLANDAAIVCVELRVAGQDRPVASLPPGLGCQGTSPDEELSLEIGEDGQAELFVRFTDREIREDVRARLTLTLGILGGAFLIAVLSAAIGFRLIVARPLRRLSEAIQRSMDSGERIPAQGGGAKELHRIIAAYNTMIARDNERDRALSGAHAALHHLNDTLEVRIIERTKELDAERIRANAANEAKSRFLATMSHEIRTPLNGILGLTEWLRERTKDADQRHMIDTIHDSGSALQRILSDILDLSSLDADRMMFEVAPFDPSEPLGAVRRLLDARAVEKGISLTVERDPSLPALVLGDPGRVRQVLLNLLSNAVTFTKRGDVTASVRCLEVADGTATIEWAIADTGIGIAADQIDGLFDAFTQADSSFARRFGGAGLGLAISRRLAERMGGTITVESTLGQGSCFRLRLPLRLAAPVHQAPVATHPTTLASPVRILMAEDNPTNQLVVRRLLRDQPVTLDIRPDGARAVEAVKQSTFDLILMDLSMPEMDGLEATRVIRAMGGRMADIPIIALTANAFESDRRAAFEAGMTLFLAKPISKPILLGAIAQALSDNADGPAETRGTMVTS